VGASTSFLRVGYIACGSPGDLISVMREAPFHIVGAPGYQMVLQVLVPQGSLGPFCKGSPWSGYLTCICSAILGGILGKRKVEHMGLQSISPPF
jgi:hypothetical protein